MFVKKLLIMEANNFNHEYYRSKIFTHLNIKVKFRIVFIEHIGSLWTGTSVLTENRVVAANICLQEKLL